MRPNATATNKFLALCFTFVALSIASAGDDGEPPMMRFTLASKITKITIQEMGVKTEVASEMPENCKDFKMTAAEVHAYFKNTSMISEQHFNHTINWSPCYIRGSLLLKDGRSGDWSIKQYRGGRLIVGKHEFFLYCPSRCKAKALI
jgi:hypothetical protein